MHIFMINAKESIVVHILLSSHKKAGIGWDDVAWGAGRVYDKSLPIPNQAMTAWAVFLGARLYALGNDKKFSDLSVDSLGERVDWALRHGLKIIRLRKAIKEVTRLKDEPKIFECTDDIFDFFSDLAETRQPTQILDLLRLKDLSIPQGLERAMLQYPRFFKPKRLSL